MLLPIPHDQDLPVPIFLTETGDSVDLRGKMLIQMDKAT